MSFVHLQVRTAYSLLDSTISIEELVSSAVEKGYKQLAICDHNVMYGAIKFYEACLDNNIKPIIGMSADIETVDNGDSFPLALFAVDKQGYDNLMKISSAIQTKAKKGLPMKWLEGYASGLLAITPATNGELEKELRQGNGAVSFEVIERYKAIFGENFYIGTCGKGLEQELEALSQKSGVKIVAGLQTHYLNKKDKVHYDAMKAISEDKLLSEIEEAENLDGVTDKLPNHFLSKQEANATFKQVHIINSYEVAEKCNLELSFQQRLLPKYPIPQGHTAKTFLYDLCQRGFKYRYKNPTKAHFNRLNYELRIIDRMDFNDYFLVVWDFMKFARDKGILTGPGRGSAAGSIVSYVLMITDVDPIQYNLVFERFLNPERISMPDIDIDFPDNRRDEVIQYVVEKYGQNHVAQIITFGTFGAKSSIRDAGRAYGLDTKALEMLSKNISSRLGTTIESALSESKILRNIQHENDTYRKVFETAMKWEGLPRHSSVHAAGVVMSSRMLTYDIPIQEGNDGVYKTQYPMEQLEHIGLLKMDFLALRNLTLLDNIVKLIHKNQGTNFNLKKISFDDEKTFKLFQRGDTIGVFQLESDGIRNVLRKLKPTTFEDVIAVLALYRPGPMDNIPTFVKRKHGQETVEYPHPHLKPILENTYGIIVYQEQILQIAATMAGFTLGEADLLRKAVSKKNKEVLDKERIHFVAGSKKKGYSENVANGVYDLIVKFANYGFNRSHSVSYGVIAYQLAYLKANFPLFFNAEMMTSVVGHNEKIATLVQNLRMNDIKILPPSVNKSDYGFTVENNGNSLRFGISSVKGVSNAAVKEILKLRNERAFADFFDFVSRVNVKIINEKVIESLIYAGCFDEFGKDRAVFIANISAAMEHAKLMNPKGEGPGMFTDELMAPRYHTAPPMNQSVKLEHEKQVLGVYLSAHPISRYRKVFNRFGVQPISGLVVGAHIIVSGIVTRSKVIRTKKGDEMAFLEIADDFDSVEVTVFPKVYKKYAQILNRGAILIFEGKVDKNETNSKIQIVADEVVLPDEAAESIKQAVYIKIPEAIETPQLLSVLKRTIYQYSGKTRVYLTYEKNSNTILLGRKDWVNATESFVNDCAKLVGHDNIQIVNK